MVFRAFRSEEVQKSTRKFPHGLDFILIYYELVIKTQTFFSLFKLWKKMYVPDYGHIYDLSYLKQISGKYCKIQRLFHALYLKYLGAQLKIHFQKEFQNCLEFVSGGGHHCYCWVCFLVKGYIGCGVSNWGMTETN